MIDHEEIVRDEITNLLSDDFHCFNEVIVKNLLWNTKLKVDMVIIPRDWDFADYVFGIELKNSASFTIGNHASCLKQTADYAYSAITPDNDIPEIYHGKITRACFLYPAPSDVRSDRKAEMIAMQLAASKFGAGTIQFIREKQYLSLNMANETWSSKNGFSFHAKGILTGKRRIGSQKKDVFKLLEEQNKTETSSLL